MLFLTKYLGIDFEPSSYIGQPIYYLLLHYFKE